MKVLLFYSLVAAAIMGQLGIAHAATVNWPQGLSKGSTVVLKVSSHSWVLWKVDRPHVVYGGGIVPIYSNDAASVIDEVVKFRTRIFPAMREFKAEKISEAKNQMGQRCDLLELRSQTEWLKICLDTAKADAQVSQLLYVGTVGQFKKSDYFQEQVLAPISANTFVGPLAGLPPAAKTLLFELVNYKFGSIDSTTYKGQSYLLIGVDGDSVFNSLRLDQSARVATTINDTLLLPLKSVASIVAPVGIDGIKLKSTIKHKSFLEEAALPTDDQLEIYVPLNQAKAFVAAEITSQQLMDASVVILNGNRIQAVLTSGAH